MTATIEDSAIDNENRRYPVYRKVTEATDASFVEAAKHESQPFYQWDVVQVDDPTQKDRVFYVIMHHDDAVDRLYYKGQRCQAWRSWCAYILFHGKYYEERAI